MKFGTCITEYTNYVKGGLGEILYQQKMRGSKMLPGPPMSPLEFYADYPYKGNVKFKNEDWNTFPFRKSGSTDGTETLWLMDSGIAIPKLLMEERFYNLGQPSFKVYPAMAIALMETDTSNILCGQFKMPHPVFCMRFPIEEILLTDKEQLAEIEFFSGFRSMKKEREIRLPAPKLKSGDLSAEDLEFGDLLFGKIDPSILDIYGRNTPYLHSISVVQLQRSSISRKLAKISGFPKIFIKNKKAFTNIKIVEEYLHKNVTNAQKYMEELDYLLDPNIKSKILLTYNIGFKDSDLIWSKFSDSLTIYTNKDHPLPERFLPIEKVLWNLVIGMSLLAADKNKPYIERTVVKLKGGKCVCGSEKPYRKCCAKRYTAAGLPIGYAVGRDIKLARRSLKEGTYYVVKGRGRKLEYAHPRIGHWRNYIGNDEQGNKVKKLTWVRPTIVGKHLPFKPKSTDYEISDHRRNPQLTPRDARKLRRRKNPQQQKYRRNAPPRTSAFWHDDERVGERSHPKECLHPGCDQPFRGRGLCRSHNSIVNQMLRRGQAIKEDLIERNLIEPYLFNYSDELKARAVKLYQETGLAYVDIAERLNVKRPDAIRSWVKKAKARKVNKPIKQRRKLDKKRDKAIELCRNTNLSYPKIARKIGATTRQVRNWCLHSGARKIKPRKMRKYSLAQKQRAQKLCETLTLKEVSDIMKIPAPMIKGWCNEVGLHLSWTPENDPWYQAAVEILDEALIQNTYSSILKKHVYSLMTHFFRNNIGALPLVEIPQFIEEIASALSGEDQEHYRQNPKLVCKLCGNSYSHIFNHIKKGHGWGAREYILNFMPEWSEADWKNSSNMAIADQLGLSLHYVAKIRKLLSYQNSMLEQRKERFKILIPFLMERKIITLPEYTLLVDIDAQAAFSDLKYFVKEGMLTKTKSGAINYYLLP